MTLYKNSFTGYYTYWYSPRLETLSGRRQLPVARLHDVEVVAEGAVAVRRGARQMTQGAGRAPADSIILTVDTEYIISLYLQ